MPLLAKDFIAEIKSPPAIAKNFWGAILQQLSCREIFSQKVSNGIHLRTVLTIISRTV